MTLLAGSDGFMLLEVLPLMEICCKGACQLPSLLNLKSTLRKLEWMHCTPDTSFAAQELLHMAGRDASFI